MNWDTTLIGLLTALGIGLLIGTVRERLHKPGVVKAGVRTHAVVAILGAISFSLGTGVFISALLTTGFMIAIAYRQSAPEDPGMTGEFTLFLTLVLSGFAIQNPALAAAIGVVVACLVFIKKPLRKFSQEVLTEKELEDALMLCASALVVLPLLPTQAMDPWNALQPYGMWKIVVLIMGVGMAGHILMRIFGPQWGLPLAGFFTGLISSTAAVAEFGRTAHEKPDRALLASAAAMFSVLSSLLLFTLVLAMSSEQLVRSVAWPLFAAGITLTSVGIYFLRHAEIAHDIALPTSHRAFKPSHALLIAATISAVTLGAAWLRELFGDSGILATSIIVGFTEIHAAAVSISQMGLTEQPQLTHASWGVVAILGASVISKTVLAYLSGGKKYGQHMTVGLGLAIAAAAISMYFAH